MNKTKLALICAAAVFTLSGCATANNTQRGAAIGAVVGAVAGKATGDHDKSRYLWGAVVGAIAGTAIGNYMDKQEEALREQLSDTGVDIVREGDNLRLVMPSSITFATNSATVSPEIAPILQDVALILNEYDKTTLVISGHTDDIGSEEYNFSLSERRALSVKNQLIGYGVNTQRITTVGMGESAPKLPNTSDANRLENRRVELSIYPNQAPAR